VGEAYRGSEPPASAAGAEATIGRSHGPFFIFLYFVLDKVTLLPPLSLE
jgi:hypothetical protein